MTSTDLPEVIDNTAEGRFEIHVDGHVAFAEYRLLKTGILFPHTLVPEALEGRGIGGALVKHGLAYARSHALKVMPVCTFFAGYIKKHPEWHDVVHPDYRAALGI